MGYVRRRAGLDGLAIGESGHNSPEVDVVRSERLAGCCIALRGYVG